jgi:Flp pilus assembly protein TadD
MALFSVLINRWPIRFAALILAFLPSLLEPVFAADRRVALVIGNSTYARASKLLNPLNDAIAIEDLLKLSGFDKVVRASDLGVVQMRRTLRNFADDARDADIAVVFYAGHGIEVNNTNYLIPVDAVLERDIDVEDETISLHRVGQVLEGARRLRLIILDACRDNPFVRSMTRTIAGRSIGRGLARVEIASADTLIAYAAKAGSTAADGDFANSPYTIALVQHLVTPGLDVRLALGRVRDEVIRTTGKRQEPFVYGSLGGAELPLVPAPALPTPQPAPIASPPASTEHEAAVAWNSIKETRSTVVLDAFIRRFRDSFHGDLAKQRLDELKRAESSQHAATALPKEPLATPRTEPETKRPAATANVIDNDVDCFSASSDTPEVVIRTCSTFLLGRPPKTRLERALNRRGLAYVRTERYNEALADFNRLIASNRTNSGYFGNRISVHRALKQYDLALRDAGETIRLSPRLAFGYHNRASIYFDIGKYEEAIADLDRAIAAKDAFVFSIYDRGRAYAKLGRYGLAVRDFTTVLEREPTSVWAYRERGLAYVGSGEVDKARADLRKFLAQEPNEPEALQALRQIGQ